MQKQSKAESAAQQKFMGMVHSVQKGDMKAPSKEVAEVAKEIKPSAAKDFAKTKREGLPEHVKESYFKGFAKRAAQHGLDNNQTVELFKVSAAWNSPMPDTGIPDYAGAADSLGSYPSKLPMMANTDTSKILSQSGVIDQILKSLGGNERMPSDVMPPSPQVGGVEPSGANAFIESMLNKIRK